MHKSVLLDEVLENLNINEDGIYVDATLGYAGHSGEILKRLNKGSLFAFDQDVDAIKFSQEKLSKIGSNYEIIKSNFKNLRQELEQRGITKIDGILFDLGVSSPQLDTVERGFSFHNDAYLDMRMDQSSKLDAYYVVNNYTFGELMDIFTKYGEEKYAKSIANAIIKYRSNKSIERTLELVNIISDAVPFKYKRETHPARRVFQAIRIEVNKEIEILNTSLEDAIAMLKPGGRICVITFHSLEDRICKQVFKKYSEISSELKRLPVIPEEFKPTLEIIGKYKASAIELEENNRARSATLRVAEKR